MKTHFLLAAATLLAASSAHAASGTWSVDANGNWSNTANWTTTTLADGETFSATFSNNITADRTVTLDSARTIGGLTFNDAGTTPDSNWALTNGGNAANILTLDNLAGAGTTTGNGANISVSNTATISLQLAGGVLYKTGAGVLVLSNSNNSYSGSLNNQTTGLYLSAGTVRVDSNGALGASGAIIQVESSGAVLASIAPGTLATGRSIFLFGSSGSVTLGDAVGTGDMSFTDINRGLGSSDRSINVANAGQTVTFTGNFLSTDSSTSGTTFIKGGAGTLTIKGTGTSEVGYSKITVTGGTLNGTVFADLGVASSFGKASAAGATGLMTLDGGAIGLVDGAASGVSYTTNRLVQIGNATAGATGTILNNATSNTLSFTNAALTYGTTNQTRTLVLGGTNTGANDFGSAIGNNGTGLVSVSKIGVGTWALSGTNTYTGATNITAGKLQLDFATGGTSNILSASTALSLGGGTLEIKGGGSEVNTQTVNGVSGVGTLLLTQNSATSIDFTLGAIAAGSNINFVGSDATAAALGTTNFLTSTAAGANDGTGRLGASLWNGTTWASTSNIGGATRVVGWTGAFDSTLTTDGAVSGPTVGNVLITGGASAGIAATYGSAATIDSLLMTGANDTSVALGTNTLTVGSGANAVGVIAIGANGNSLTIDGTTGSVLTAGTAAGASTLMLSNASTLANTTLTVNAAITNGASTTVALTTSGTVKLTGINTYTGATTIASGTLEFAGGTQKLSGNISGNGGLTKSGTGTLTLTGTNTYTGGTTVSNGMLQIGDGTTNGTITGTVSIASGATLRVKSNTAAVTTVPWATVSGAGTIAIEGTTGAGLLSDAMALTNNFTGTLEATNGRVGNFGNNSTTALGGTTAIVVKNGGMLALGAASGGTFNVSAAISLEGVGYGSGYDVALWTGNGPSITNLNGNITLTGNAGVGTRNGGTTNYNGVIQGGFNLIINDLTGGATLDGTAVFNAANTYSGVTSLNAGTLKLANTNALQNSTLSYSTGTLAFDSAVTAKAFTLGGLSGSSDIALVNNSAAAIALSVGKNNADTSYSGKFTGAGSLVKIGNGSLTLSGASTHTGGTAVNGGKLITGNSASALGAGALTIGGGTLQIGTTRITGITSLTVNSGTLDTTAGGVTTTGAFNLLGGTWLVGSTINGVSAGSFTLTAGTIDLALIATIDKQTSGFSLITGGTGTNSLTNANFINGAAGYSYGLDDNGDLVVTAVPEPSTYGLIGAGALAAVAVVRRRRKLAGKAA